MSEEAPWIDAYRTVRNAQPTQPQPQPTPTQQQPAQTTPTMTTTPPAPRPTMERKEYDPWLPTALAVHQASSFVNWEQPTKSGVPLAAIGTRPYSEPSPPPNVLTQVAQQSSNRMLAPTPVTDMEYWTGDPIVGKYGINPGGKEPGATYAWTAADVYNIVTTATLLYGAGKAVASVSQRMAVQRSLAEREAIRQEIFKSATPEQLIEEEAANPLMKQIEPYRVYEQPTKTFWQNVQAPLEVRPGITEFDIEMAREAANYRPISIVKSPIWKGGVPGQIVTPIPEVSNWMATPALKAISMVPREAPIFGSMLPYAVPSVFGLVGNALRPSSPQQEMYQIPKTIITSTPTIPKQTIVPTTPKLTPRPTTTNPILTEPQLKPIETPFMPPALRSGIPTLTPIEEPSRKESLFLLPSLIPRFSTIQAPFQIPRLAPIQIPRLTPWQTTRQTQRQSPIQTPVQALSPIQVPSQISRQVPRQTPTYKFPIPQPTKTTPGQPTPPVKIPEFNKRSGKKRERLLGSQWWFRRHAIPTPKFVAVTLIKGRKRRRQK